MSRATHTGTCQCCGRIQKLPRGKLSKHGYTKDWGFFNGICPGADHAPWETSKDYAEWNLTQVRERLQDELRRLECPEALPKIYEYRERFAHKRTPVVIKSIFTMGDKVVINHKHVFNYGLPLEHYLKEKQERAVAEQNYVIKQLRQYIKWQENRCQTWRANPAGLKPVD